jgi:hypothetical protein
MLMSAEGILDAIVIPTLDGEDVSSVERSCDLVLQAPT